MSILQRAIDEKLPHWVCPNPDCGTVYFSVQTPRMCPACEAKKAEREKVYWDNKRASMRSVAGDIVAKMLNKSDNGGK